MSSSRETRGQQPTGQDIGTGVSDKGSFFDKKDAPAGPPVNMRLDGDKAHDAGPQGRLSSALDAPGGERDSPGSKNAIFGVTVPELPRSRELAKTAPDAISERKGPEGKIFPPGSTLGAEITEIWVNSEMIDGTAEEVAQARQRARDALSERLTQAYLMGEPVTIVQERGKNNKLRITIVGGPTSIGGTDKKGKTSSGLVLGGKGEAVTDLRTREEELDTKYTNWAAMQLSFAGEIKEKKGGLSFTDSLLSAPDGGPFVNIIQLTPASDKLPRQLTMTNLIASTFGLWEGVDPEKGSRAEAGKMAVEELTKAQRLGFWECKVATAIPDQQTEEETEQHLERIATRVASATGDSTLPYGWAVARKEDQLVRIYDSASDALANISGSYASTEFLSHALDVVPTATTEHSGVAVHERWDFGEHNKDTEPGVRVPLGTILLNNDEYGEPFGISLLLFRQHVILVGQSGTGKSETVLKIEQGAIKEGTTITMLSALKAEDFYKIAARVEDQFLEDNPAIRAQIEAIRDQWVQDLTRVKEEWDAHPDTTGSDFTPAHLTNKKVQAYWAKVHPDIPLPSKYHENPIDYLDDPRFVAYWEKAHPDIPLPTERPPAVYVVNPDDVNAVMAGLDIFTPPKGVSYEDWFNTCIEILASGYEGDPEGKTLLETYWKAALFGVTKEEEPDPEKQMRGAAEEQGLILNLNTSMYAGGMPPAIRLELIRRKVFEAIDKVGGTTYDPNIRANVIKFMLTRLGNLSKGTLGKMINNEYTIDPDLLANRHSIFSLETAAEPELGIIGQFIGEIIYQTRKQREKESKHGIPAGTDQIIVLDEAQRMLHEGPGGVLTPTGRRLLGIEQSGRGYNIGMWTITQSPDAIPDLFEKIPAIRMSHKLDPDDDREDLGDDMRATKTQKRQLANLDVGVVAVSLPDFDRPLRIEVENASSKSTDKSRVQPAAGLVKEKHPPTYTWNAKAENFLMGKNTDMKEHAKALKAWAALALFAEARPDLNVTDFSADAIKIPDHILEYFRAINRDTADFNVSPEFVKLLVRKVAKNAVDDRHHQVLGLIHQGAPMIEADSADGTKAMVENPDFIPDTRIGLTNRIIQVMVNEIYEGRPDLQLPKVRGNFAMEMYTVDPLVRQLDNFIGKLQAGEEEFPHPYFAAWRAEGLLPNDLEIGDEISAVGLRQKLVEWERKQEDKLTSATGSGRYKWGDSANRGGSYLEDAIGMRWYEEGAKEAFITLVDGMVTDGHLARRLKEEFGAYIDEQRANARIASLEAALYTLEDYIVRNVGALNEKYPGRFNLAKEIPGITGTKPLDILRSINSELGIIEPDENRGWGTKVIRILDKLIN